MCPGWGAKLPGTGRSLLTEETWENGAGQRNATGRDANQIARVFAGFAILKFAAGAAIMEDRTAKGGTGIWHTRCKRR